MQTNLPAHIKKLNNIDTSQGSCVIYVMSRDQRAHDNPALHAAQEYAIEHKLPLHVLFHLYSSVPNRTEQHYQFMLEGLKDLELELALHNIPFVITTGKPSTSITTYIHKHKASAVFFDFSPLRGPKNLKNKIVSLLHVPCFLVDSHNIVPVWTASDKEEWAAYTIRPKINKLLPDFINQTFDLHKHPFSITIHHNDWKTLLPSIRTNIPLRSGEQAASQMLKEFIYYRLDGYDIKRNDPSIDHQSSLSPYLHFGQISARHIARAISKHIATHPALKEDADAFLEELIIRKELSDNFCFYNTSYDTYEGIRPWAKATLEKHVKDKREVIYTGKQLEHAETHDKAWNAAQVQMVFTGKMHGYMRMYWAKKILEWTPDAETAIQLAVTLNDRYSLDGYDPNGYTGILWSIGGVHDRPWFQRPIYGTIRYMSYSGLEKKFDIQTYINTWDKKE